VVGGCKSFRRLGKRRERLSGKWPECQRRLSLSGRARTDNALVKINGKRNTEKYEILKEK